VRKLLFVTGTRADFGKLKPLIRVTNEMEGFSAEIFVTGMHMLQRYGSTWEEVVWSDLAPVHPFVNQAPADSMDLVLAKTVMGLSDFVKESLPDLIIVHGDRVEALAGSLVGSLSNIRVAHIEGGELSGTVDEVIRHAVSKLSHWHFVSNDESKTRLIQLGEHTDRIFVIGSPDIDMMDSPHLPSLEEAFSHYRLNFLSYGILIFHPVTTELGEIEEQTRSLMEALVKSSQNLIIIESNNDSGSEVIRAVYEEFRGEPSFRFFPSMRFEYFLAILKEAKFIIGNSSAGIREAPHYGVPAINLGSRQLNRVVSGLVLNCSLSGEEIQASIVQALRSDRVPEQNFGSGNSAEGFRSVLETRSLWDSPLQKQFIDAKERTKEHDNVS